MNNPRSFPDLADRQALRSWLAARHADTDRPTARTVAELRGARFRKLACAMSAEPSTAPDSGSALGRGYATLKRPFLRFALEGEPVRQHRVDTAVLGEWLRALQSTVHSVAYALDDLRPTREAGRVPGDIQRATRLFSGAVFASSYGMVLEGSPEPTQPELPGTGSSGALLDRAINKILDVTDGAGSGIGAEEAVLDAALPLGRRALGKLAELSAVLASAGADVTMHWQSQTTNARTSHLTSAGAERCRTVLKTARLEESDQRLAGTVVGGSKLRGVIEIETEDRGVVSVQVVKDIVTTLLASFADQQVVIDVNVLTATSPDGREHRSYRLVDFAGYDSELPEVRVELRSDDDIERQ